MVFAVVTYITKRDPKSVQSFWKIFSTGLSTGLWVTRCSLYTPPFGLRNAFGPGSGLGLDLDLSLLGQKPRGLSIFGESRSGVLITGLGIKNPQPGFWVGGFFVLLARRAAAFVFGFI